MNKIRAAGAAAGVVLVSGVVLQVSSAAFTGEVANEDNSWTAGTVSLTDGEAATMFTATGMVPGDVEKSCIEVTYTGDVDLDAVATLEAALGDTAELAPHLLVTVDVGDAGTTCDGTDGALTDLPVIGSAEGGSTPVVTNEPLSTFAADGAADVTGWTPTAADDMRPFSFVVQLDPDTPNSMQGASASGTTFTWRVSS